MSSNWTSAGLVVLAALCVTGCDPKPLEIKTYSGTEVLLGAESFMGVAAHGTFVDRVSAYDGARVIYRSSLDGELGTNTRAISVALSEGVHTITVEAWWGDEHRADLDDSAVYTVHRGASPTVRFVEPSAGTIHTPNTPIRLLVEGTDPEDGALPGSRITWHVEGVIDQTRGDELVLRLAEGTHRATVRASDSSGNLGEATLTLFVQPSPSATGSGGSPPSPSSTSGSPASSPSPVPSPPPARSRGLIGALGQ